MLNAASTQLLLNLAGPCLATAGLAVVTVYGATSANMATVTTPESPRAVAAATLPTSRAERVDLNIVKTVPLFGTFEPEREPVVEAEPDPEPELDIASLQETKLPLRLDGVLFATPAAETLVLIAPQNGTAVEYRVGDIVPGNAEVHSIASPRQVVIQRGEDLETLSIPFLTDLSGPAARRTAVAAPARRAALARRRMPNNPSVAARDQWDGDRN